MGISAQEAALALDRIECVHAFEMWQFAYKEMMRLGGNRVGFVLIRAEESLKMCAHPQSALVWIPGGEYHFDLAREGRCSVLGRAPCMCEDIDSHAGSCDARTHFVVILSVETSTVPKIGYLLVRTIARRPSRERVDSYIAQHGLDSEFCKTLKNIGVTDRAETIDAWHRYAAGDPDMHVLLSGFNRIRCDKHVGMSPRGAYVDMAKHYIAEAQCRGDGIVILGDGMARDPVFLEILREAFMLPRVHGGGIPTASAATAQLVLANSESNPLVIAQCCSKRVRRAARAAGRVIHTGVSIMWLQDILPSRSDEKTLAEPTPPTTPPVRVLWQPWSGPASAPCDYRACVSDAASTAGPSQQCSRCKRVVYCSEACQRADWPRHSAECAASCIEHTEPPSD